MKRRALLVWTFALGALLFWLLLRWPLAFAAAPPAAELTAATLADVDDAVGPHRQALYLFLRIAGVAWISVEWVAAVILWRAHGLLRRAVEDAS